MITKIMVVGPMPPAIGGISTHVSHLLNSKFDRNFYLIPFTTTRAINFKKGPVESKIGNSKLLILIESIIETIYHLIIYPSIIIREKPNIIHIHTSSYWSFLENSLYVLIAKLFNKKTILHIHSGEFDFFYLKTNFLMKRYIEWILNLNSQIITLSKNWKKIFIENIKIETKIDVIYNGYDSSLFYPMDTKQCRDTLDLPDNKMILITVGNLLQVKGHQYLIEAMSKIVEYRKDVLCIIIGEGKLRSKLEQQIKLSKLDDYFMLVGKKAHDEIPLWMNAADLFVLPSLKEGNPTVMCESLGVGLPFIGTKVGAIPEIICSEEYGCLVDPKNSIDLAEKIIYSLRIKWDKQKIAQYSEKFSWDKLVLDISMIYEYLSSS